MLYGVLVVVYVEREAIDFEIAVCSEYLLLAESKFFTEKYRYVILN